MDAGRRQETPGSEKREFVIHHIASNINISRSASVSEFYFTDVTNYHKLSSLLSHNSVRQSSADLAGSLLKVLQGQNQDVSDLGLFSGSSGGESTSRHI